ncbi:MAG: GntR family transcriptional regulator [Acidiferrobacterales bacterium]|nr:GntR family transcriptional regulator [Acidiferrobacterales bacterium]
MPEPQSLYESLRHQIITMEIPPGADLDEKSLVKRFGVSRTPVREAIIRLSAEGLLEIRKNRGAVVTSLDLLTLQSIFEAGDLIEKAYTRLACLRRTDGDLAEIRRWMERFEKDLNRQDISAMVKSNSQFHYSIAKASGNKYFFECYRRILADHERIAQLWYTDNMSREQDTVSKTIVKQHRELFKAIESRNANLAEKISMEHASLCKEGVRETLRFGESVIANLEVEQNAFNIQ